MVGDISSAYLEAKTKEKVCFTAGPEFGKYEGHTFIIHKALYGLRTSGANWHQRFADTLRDLGYWPCKADNDVWLKDCGTHYEYICVYVDDIMHMSLNPQAFFDSLKDTYGYKLAGVGEPSYHLGGNFYRDEDGTLAWGAQSYIKKMLLSSAKLFDLPPKEFSSPMDEGDHPELDLTPELDSNGIRLYQSLIGALQWAVTLGRFDIFVGVATMSSFRVAPRQGHLERLKRIYGYLKRNSDGAIRFRTGIPDHESRNTPQQYDWINSVYGPNKEELPPDMPTPKGKPMRTTTYEDANLVHCLATGRSMSGIIHLLNQTPIQWFCKKQNVVETATYGSEFMVARQATEQIMDLRYTLRMMGIPLDGPAWMFGDNQSVITSSTIPHFNLNKRHNALSYHRVREAMSAQLMYFIHIDGKLNPSDVMTKFLSWAKFWPLIQPFLFWKGETMKDIPPTTPIPQIIADLKGYTSPSGLWGVTSGLKEVPMAASPSEENNTALAVNTAQKVSWKPQLTTVKYLVTESPPIPLEDLHLLQKKQKPVTGQHKMSSGHVKWKASETLRNKTTQGDAWEPVKGPSDSVKGPSDPKELLNTWTLVTHSRNSTKSLHSGSKYTQKSYKGNSCTRNVYNVQDLANDPEGNLAMTLNH
jgi:hypothetical protein